MNRFIDRFWQARARRLAACPMPLALDLPQGSRVLVVAPHPDDETLGCGGTLALLRRRGCSVRVLVVTDGAAGDPAHYVDDVVAVRQAECRAALAQLGVEDVSFLGEPDGALTVHPGVRHAFAQAFIQFRPDWVFAPAALDYHRDHVAVSLGIAEAWRRHGHGCRLFYYEIWAPLPITHVVDVSEGIAAKRAALAQYQLPLRYGNYTQASEGLMAYRGLFLPQGSGRPALPAEGFLEEWANGGMDRALFRWREKLEGLLSR